MFQREISGGWGSYRSIIIRRWLDIQDGPRHSIFWIGSITGRICEDRWISMFEIVTVAKGLGHQGMQCLEFFDLCQYQRSHGKIFQ
jgi:hypothetical protein